MNRIHLTSDRTKWFDKDKADKFEGAGYFNGSNWIDKNTGEQFRGQNLYKTPSKNWVLVNWSNYQGAEDLYSKIPDSEAYNWLLENEYYDEVPDEILNSNEI